MWYMLLYFVYLAYRCDTPNIEHVFRISYIWGIKWVVGLTHHSCLLSVVKLGVGFMLTTECIRTRRSTGALCSVMPEWQHNDCLLCEREWQTLSSTSSGTLSPLNGRQCMILPRCFCTVWTTGSWTHQQLANSNSKDRPKIWLCTVLITPGKLQLYEFVKVIQVWIWHKRIDTPAPES